MTKREGILQAVVTALTGTTGVSTRIYRTRPQAFLRSESPALNVETISDVPFDGTLPRVTWELTFSVTVMIRSDSPEEDADNTIASLYSKIMSNSSLASLIVGIEPGPTSFQVLDADGGGLGIIELQFKVTYQTALGDLTSV